MTSTIRAPKQWCLTKTESINSFENWKQNLVYTLSLDANFAPFLVEGAVWKKKTKAEPLRGFINDVEEVPVAQRRTAQQKVNMAELMLGQIANYCPIISRNTIVKNSTSIEFIWNAIRLHFGFQATGAHFVDFDNIKLQPNERSEDLFQRIMAFVEDSLLGSNSNITHHSEQIIEDEELSPTLENFVVLTWLRLINPALPKLVKQRYGTELRSRTLASIKPEISQAMNSLLDELTSHDEVKVMRTEVSSYRSNRDRRPPRPIIKQPVLTTGSREKSCPLCKQADRPDNHYLSECRFLPERDRKYMAKARQIAAICECDEEDDHENYPCDDHEPDGPGHVSRLVQVRQSPYLDTFFLHHTVRITIDSGATCNMIRLSTVKRLGAQITTSSQSARQADGHSPLEVVGETHMTFTRDNQQLQFEGLVVENLDVEVLAGIPFMESNDIAVRPARRTVVIRGTPYQYGSSKDKPPYTAVRRAVVLRAPPKSTTIWPGEFLEVALPDDVPTDNDYALEPRTDTQSARSTKVSQLWPPYGIVSSIAGRIRIPNDSDQPQVLKRNEHFGQVNLVFSPSDASQHPVNPSLSSREQPSPSSNGHNHSSSVSVDPANILPADVSDKFHTVLKQFDNVFNPKIEGYNGASGPFEAKVNMGPVEPPQRKGRLPQYSRNRLVELQQKFDELEELGVFKRPEDIGISIEYLNPSFLVKKSNGGSRLVTAFGEVGQYSKPQPSLMPDVDSTLRLIGQWKHIITSDLTSAFYQIPLARESMRYCGVATPYRGTRVYARSAMGMPGSETALEELMCRVLGDLLQEGVVAKLADDLYCGGNTPEELLENWIKVLTVLSKNNLRLSASKTIINPKCTTILGWTWSQGTLTANPHRISVLSSCSPPEKVGAMKSFIGAYKVLARVVPGCSSLLSPLDDSISGRSSTEVITWTDELHTAFTTAKKALSNSRSITLPKSDDQLWIVTDGAVRKPGIAATYYVTRKGNLHLAGFFSAKLRCHQASWLPCEIEALAIATSVKHFSPYIIQSSTNACVVTDSKPCVQAYQKLCRGEFSASPRVSTFLSTVSRYQVQVQHVAGASILPSDFASRNAVDCNDMACQVCNFVNVTQQSVIRRTTIAEILSGKTHLPFTSRAAWLSLQSECPDLRRTHAHLRQGTRPSKKTSNIKDVKRYLNVATISKDGLLIVKRNELLSPTRECIIVPRQVLDGLVTALHIQLNHPSAHQLKMVICRYFFALDVVKSIEGVTKGCHQCASLLKCPHTTVEQSTTAPPDAVGVSFAADVIKRNRQLILVVRECVTSFTTTTLIEDERHQTLRDALIQLCIELRPLDGPPSVIRTDPAPGFKALANDEVLREHRLSIEIGRVKNKNKNPVAERAVQELQDELLRQDPLDGYVSQLALSTATANLNARFRSRGLSSREMWYQRDQFSNSQLPVNDRQLITRQNEIRSHNHPYSERSKAPRGKIAPSPVINVGDLTYLYVDRNKSSARDRYLVVSVEGVWCNIKKFSGSQLRNTSYRVKRSECYKVPTVVSASSKRYPTNNISDDEEENITSPSPTASPTDMVIPQEISASPDTDFEPPGEQEEQIDIHEHEEATTDNHVDNQVTDTLQEDVIGCNEPELRRSTRNRRRPKYLDDYATDRDFSTL